MITSLILGLLFIFAAAILWSTKDVGEGMKFVTRTISIIFAALGAIFIAPFFFSFMFYSVIAIILLIAFVALYKVI